MSITTPRLELKSVVTYSLAAVVSVLVVGYILFQARFLVIGPQIVLTKELPAVANERTVTLVGRTANITNLTLNGRTIYTDEQGTFTESLVLENGYTIMVLRAHDRFGRERTLERTVVYRPISTIN